MRSGKRVEELNLINRLRSVAKPAMPAWAAAQWARFISRLCHRWAVRRDAEIHWLLFLVRFARFKNRSPLRCLAQHLAAFRVHFMKQRTTCVFVRDRTRDNSNKRRQASANGNDPYTRAIIGHDQGFSMRNGSEVVAGARPHSIDAVEERLLCVVCMDAERGALFLPCGHLCACTSCADAAMAREARCLICREIAAGTQRALIV